MPPLTLSLLVSTLTLCAFVTQSQTQTINQINALARGAVNSAFTGVRNKPVPEQTGKYARTRYTLYDMKITSVTTPPSTVVSPFPPPANRYKMEVRGGGLVIGGKFVTKKRFITRRGTLSITVSGIDIDAVGLVNPGIRITSSSCNVRGVRIKFRGRRIGILKWRIVQRIVSRKIKDMVGTMVCRTARAALQNSLSSFGK